MPYAIDDKFKLELGGVKQSIRIRSRDSALPVLLFLHGGPGVCDRQWVLYEQEPLAQICTLVCWDQRGAGLSWSGNLNEGDMSVGRIVEDAHELAVYLKQRFQKRAIYLVGHAWGSLLGVLFARKYPLDVAGYIGMGQFVSGPEGELMSYKAVYEQARERGNSRALSTLSDMGYPKDGLYCNYEDFFAQRRLITKFADPEYNEDMDFISGVMMPGLRRREYTLLGLYKYLQGAYFSIRTLWAEVVKYDLRYSVPRLDVPVFLTEGRHDTRMPTVLAEEWFNMLDAPEKQWRWFENSAHLPAINEAKAWGTAVRDYIRERERIAPTSK